jgi:hypothetical protein
LNGRTVLEDLQAGLSEAGHRRQAWHQRENDPAVAAEGDPTGRYGGFATIVERGRIDRELPPEDERPVDEEELLLLASRFGRR